MLKNNLTVREICKSDFELLANYWASASDEFLKSMGAVKSKLPAKEQFVEMLFEQLASSYKEKKSYCIIWCINNVPSGHCNVNKIEFGNHAYMHLHLWTDVQRKNGMGARFVKMSLPYFFNNLKLKKLFCEPYALNIAPNKTLARAGFTFVKKYVTTPGNINFEQEVNLWEYRFENN